MNLKENETIHYDLSEAKTNKKLQENRKETCMFHTDGGNKLFCFFTFSIMNIFFFYDVKNKIFLLRRWCIKIIYQIRYAYG